MAPMEWDFNTGTFKETEEPAPAPATTTTPAPAKAAPKKEDDPWAGGFWSDLKHVAGAPVRAVGRAAGDVGEIVRALPQVVTNLPKMAAATLPGETDYEKEALQRIEAKADELGLEGGRREAYISLARPGLHQLIPGTYVAENLIGGNLEELGENPLMAALDVLPYAGTATKVITKGSGLATRAASAAEEAGKLGKAADIAEKGLTIPQTVGQVVRENLPKTGLGSQILPAAESMGRTMRAQSLLDSIGVGQRQLSQSAEAIFREVDEVVQRAGVSPERMVELTKAARLGAPDWQKALNVTEDEATLLRFTRQKGFDIAQDSLRRGELYLDDMGNVRAKADNPVLLKHMTARDRYIQKSNENWQKMQAATDPGQKRRFGDASEKLAQQAIRFDEKVKAHLERTPPAEFHEAVRARAKVRLKEQLEGKYSPDDFASVEAKLDAGAFESLDPEVRPLYESLVRETKKDWQQMQQEGWNPQWLHEVRPEQVSRVEHPRFVPHKISKPGSVKARSLYYPEPYVDDLAISVRHQALESFHRNLTESKVAEWTEKGWVKSRQAVYNDAQEMLAHLTDDPAELKGLIDDYFEAQYREFEPTSIFGGGKPRIGGNLQNKTYLPKGLYEMLEDFSKPGKKTLINAPLRGTAGVLRTSVLRLNPMYYVGQVTSGTPLMLARGGFKDLFHLKEAARLMRNGELPSWIPEGMSVDDLKAAIPTGPRKIIGDVEQAAKFRAGESLARMVHDYWGQTGKPAEIAHKAVLFSDKAATIADDIYRSAGYLAELKKRLKKGQDLDVAMSGALEQASKIMNNLDRLTPVERGVVKSVFPFWSWTKHLMTYLSTYPFDHPWRAAFTMKLAQQAQEEWDEDVPQKMMRYLALGQRDKEGWQWLLGTQDLFLPWVSVSEALSLSGFMARLHPVWKIGLQYSGVDPFTAAPEKFPEYSEEIDPVTGKQRYERPSLVRLLGSGLTPEALEPLFQEEWQKELQAEKPSGNLERIARGLGFNVFQRKMEGGSKPKKAATPAKPAGELVWDFESGSFKAAE